MSTATATVAEKEGRWPLTILLSVAQTVSWGTFFYAFAVIVVQMEKELGWSKAELNGAVSLGLLVAGLVALPAGAWIDRYGGRALMTAGTLAGAALLVAWSMVTARWAFYAIYLLLGAAMATTLYEPGFAVLTRMFPQSYRQRITAMTLVAGFASTVFIPLTHWLVALMGWRQALVVLAAINIAICLPVHLFLLQDATADGRKAASAAEAKAAAEAAGRESNAALARALRHPVFWLLLVTFMAHYAVNSGLVFHFIPLLNERGFSGEAAAAAYMVIGPAQVAGRVILALIGDRMPMKDVGKFSVTLLPLGVLLLIFLPGVAWAPFVALVLYGLGNGMATILRGTSIPDLLWRQGYGAISGAMTFPILAAKAAAPFLAALLWQLSGGYTAVLWAVFAVSAVAGACYWAAVLTAKRRQARAEPG